MVKRKGFTLVELLIAVSVGGFVVLLAGQLFRWASSRFNEHAREIVDRSATSIAENHLQNFITNGDIRFYGWSGRSGDMPLARVLIPQPRVCADRTTNGCEEDTSLVYVHYDKSVSPALSAVCFHPSDDERIIIDAGNPTFGTATFDGVAKTFTVNGGGPTGIVPGTLEINANTLVGLLAPPFATLWRATEQPESLLLNGWDGSNYSAPNALSAECLRNLRPKTGSPPHHIDNLYTVRARPWMLKQLTNGTMGNITNAILTSNRGTFPQRLFLPTLFSAGKRILNQGQADERKEFVALPCSLAGNNINCDNEPPRVTVSNVEQVRIDHQYKVALTKDNPGPPWVAPNYYEVVNTAMTGDPQCSAPECAALEIADSTNIPVRLSGESSSHYHFREFGILKQNQVSRMRFRLRFPKNTSTLHVRFP